MAWYFWVLISLAAVVILYLTLCRIIAPKLLKASMFQRGRTLEESRKFQIDNEHWDFTDYDEVWQKTEFSLTSFDGLTIRGEYVVNPASAGKPQKTAIFCHGHICNRIQSVKYADIFYKKGFNLVLYDNRSFGLSDGEYCTFGQNEVKDLSDVIDFTKRTFGGKIALHGESMGAATVLKVLETRSDDVWFVVADCPFCNTNKLFADIIRSKHLPVFPLLAMSASLAKRRYGYDFKTVNPEDSVRLANVPICFIHGTGDKLINCEHSVKMYSLCNNPESQLHLFEGAGHARCHMADPARYVETVGNFIDKFDKTA